MRKYWLYILGGLVLISPFGYIAFDQSCGFAKEIKAYSKIRPNAYYYGSSACPAVWQIKKMKLPEVKNLPVDEKIEILSQKEDKELEKAIADKFLGYNKFSASDGRKKFYIYETICNVCGLK